jgi:glutaredoxin
MNTKLKIISSIFIIIVLFSVLILSNYKKDNKVEPIINLPKEEIVLSESEFINEENKSIKKESSNIILFYGDGCPHCVIVDDYLENNNIKNKISFEHKEVYYNKENANLLVEKAQICGFNINSIGVPFLWDGQKCLVGDQDIIEFFKLKVN